MALTKRIIPCLDVRDGRTVKGINFEQIRDMGDPVELGDYYAAQGADELVFLDITATNEKRKTLTDLVMKVAKTINIPFTVGGGINTTDDVYNLLQAGADKISVNTSAVKNPTLITDIARRFGNQCVVLAVDTKQEEDGIWYVYTHGGKQPTGMQALKWLKQAEASGAGEILLTSINNDGTKQGFAIELLQAATKAIAIPVIASGGAGNKEHFSEVFTAGQADAALAAGIFHNKSLEIPLLKSYLKEQNIPIRL